MQPRGACPHSCAHIALTLSQSANKNATLWVAFINLARLAGIEPTTLGFGGQYSIH